MNEKLDVIFNSINDIRLFLLVIVIIAIIVLLTSDDIDSALADCEPTDFKKIQSFRGKVILRGIAAVIAIVIVNGSTNALSNRVLADYHNQKRQQAEIAAAEYKLKGLTGALPPAKALQAIGVDDTGTNNIVDALKSVGFEPDGLARVETDGRAINLLAVKHYKDDDYDDVTLSLTFKNGNVDTITYKNKPLMKGGKVVSGISRWYVSKSDNINGEYLAMKAVKAHMLSPDSADIDAGTLKVAKVDNVLIVTGMVSGLNVFGVPLREPFIVRMTPSGNDFKIQTISIGNDVLNY